MLQKLKNWIKQRQMIARSQWRWLWMSQADREKARAMKKLLFNLMGNAPMEDIMAHKSCSWSMTPGQEKGTMEGVQQYVKAVNGEDIKIAEKPVSTEAETVQP